MDIAGAMAGITLPPSTPERDALEDKVWAAWDRRVNAVTSRQREAAQAAYRAARLALDAYDEHH